MSFEIVVIGASTGGLKALQTLLSGLPAQFPLPIVIAQHRGNDSDSGLCDYLSKCSSMPVSEPDDKEPLLSGHVYLAPRDYHLLIEDRSFALSTIPPVRFARPSIDVLFESTADAFGPRAIGVVLTGANTDGANGAAAIKSRGGLLIVQDPNSADCPDLPAAAIAQATPDSLLPLNQIAPHLIVLSKLRTPAELLQRDVARTVIYHGS
ncbi:MAG TPA: chemotaxis protein CheB [Pyrinomonadaceae bacterium]|jgi:two-component system chemotaxis response regulator CheB|nr:chemotaxis protein CheB [Pyrinomonadaceae bacterium]